MSTSKELLVELKKASKTFTVYDHNVDSIRDRVFNFFGWGKARKIKVFQDVDLEVKRGEFIGIIGRNGSGKSTLMNMIAGTIRPDKGGNAKRYGSFIRLSLGMGFNPELSARQNVYLNASILGVSLQEIKERFEAIIAFAELEPFAETQLKFFSSGMRARLAFAVAVLVKTDLLLMDEFFGGVGDEAFKQKAQKVFKESLLQDQTIVLISHNMQTIRKYCDRVLVIHQGVVTSFDDPEAAIQYYKTDILGVSQESNESDPIEDESLDP